MYHLQCSSVFLLKGFCCWTTYTLFFTQLKDIVFQESVSLVIWPQKLLVHFPEQNKGSENPSHEILLSILPSYGDWIYFDHSEHNKYAICYAPVLLLNDPIHEGKYLFLSFHFTTLHYEIKYCLATAAASNAYLSLDCASEEKGRRKWRHVKTRADRRKWMRKDCKKGESSRGWMYTLNTQGKGESGLGELTFRTLLTPRSQSDFH